MPYLELLAGLALLLLGGELLVRGAVGTARRLGLSPLLIGLTVVGFGTSMPELLTSVEAALIGSPGIAVGNVVGSNSANVLLILGLTALLAPIPTTPPAIRRDGAAVLLAALACLAAVLWGSMERWMGLLLLALLAAYVWTAYRGERVKGGAAEADTAPPAPLWIALGFTGAGLGLVLLGAHLLVENAVALARAAGISEAVLGVTLVAVGTSLPELVASLVAAARRQPALALGNVIGSNIYNVFGILGATATVQPLDVPPEIARLDIWVMLGATLLLLLFAVTRWRISRAEGAFLLACYGGYLALLAGRL